MHGGRRRFLRSVERERHIQTLALEPVKPAVPGGMFPIWIPAYPAILAGLFSFAPDGAGRSKPSSVSLAEARNAVLTHILKPPIYCLFTARFRLAHPCLKAWAGSCLVFQNAN